MPEPLFMARLFLTGGGLLAVISLILWFVLGYGAAYWRRGRFLGAGKS